MRDPPGRAFTRACFAAAKNAIDGGHAGAPAYVEQMWPHDRQTLALVRAATNPAATNVSGWAAPLSPNATADFVGSLIGESAGAKLIGDGMRVDLSGVAAVLIPHRSSNLPNVDVAWIGEASSFPVRQFTLTTTQLGPTHKLL
jgi:hypothetical protein